MLQVSNREAKIALVQNVQKEKMEVKEEELSCIYSSKNIGAYCIMMFVDMLVGRYDWVISSCQHHRCIYLSLDGKSQSLNMASPRNQETR